MAKKINYSEYQDEFTEPKFWDKITEVAKIAGRTVILNALILYYLLMDPDVPIRYKTIIIGALGYFILPLDAVPDFVPGGYVDDAGALVAVIKMLNMSITPQIREKAEDKLAEWF